MASFFWTGGPHLVYNQHTRPVRLIQTPKGRDKASVFDDLGMKTGWSFWTPLILSFRYDNSSFPHCISVSVYSVRVTECRIMQDSARQYFSTTFVFESSFSVILPQRRFFKRIEKNVVLQVEQPPWERRRRDWRSSERWCQAHGDLKKYMPQQLWLCAGFSRIPGWLWRTYITECFCVRGCCWFSSQTSPHRRTLCLLDSFMIQKGLRGESRSGDILKMLCSLADAENFVGPICISFLSGELPADWCVLTVESVAWANVHISISLPLI